MWVGFVEKPARFFENLAGLQTKGSASIPKFSADCRGEPMTQGLLLPHEF
jgi:hypothetical protein